MKKPTVCTVAYFNFKVTLAISINYTQMQWSYQALCDVDMKCAPDYEYEPVADLDMFPDLEEVEEYPEEGDDEAGHHHEEEPVVVSQSEGDQAREPG